MSGTRKNCQRGFTILEAVITMGLLGTGIYLAMQGLEMIQSQKTSAFDRIDMEVALASSMEVIRSNISNEKIDFQARDQFLRKSSYSDVRESLELRWNQNGILTKEDCPICKGRLGYVVTPYSVGSLTLLGLYEVVLRVTHDELMPNRFQEYRFIVRGP